MDHSVDFKRQEITKAYKGPAWANRVKNMSDNQVIAVYLRLKQKGVIK